MDAEKRNAANRADKLSRLVQAEGGVQMNYLEKVKEFRNLTGINGQPEELHDKLIREELAELADALADSVVVACGANSDHPERYSKGWLDGWLLDLQMAATHADIKLDAAFEIVHRSNMSKLCTLDEIEATERKYNDLGVFVEFDLVSDGLYACRSACDHPDYPRGKLLKSVSYQAPDWSGEEWML